LLLLYLGAGTGISFVKCARQDLSKIIKFGGEHLGFKNRGAYVWKTYHDVYLAAKLLCVAGFIAG
jgi:hypothetical protein